MAEPDRDADRTDSGSQDIIDDALRMVDSLQRRLLVAGVRRGATAASAPPRKGDVWEEALKYEQPQPQPSPLEELMGIARKKGPEVAGHLGRAGIAVVGAVGETLGVVERALERRTPDPEQYSSRRSETEQGSVEAPREISGGGGH
ncbi:hypothetical protein FZ103_06965 [Streptomonospora sp. PA3]|uniref:hypothetical protein n=1 Tax=Streptomonospora sp. PA3 TaxID=2607326 RepID=UPI0012DC6AB7|nr:hypothetical protein [Streptomonospora sp. PA3]MUL40928.1 hypothetical protein [Streptomonospora sp. PA3]